MTHEFKLRSTYFSKTHNFPLYINRETAHMGRVFMIGGVPPFRETAHVRRVCKRRGVPFPRNRTRRLRPRKGGYSVDVGHFIFRNIPRLQKGGGTPFRETARIGCVRKRGRPRERGGGTPFTNSLTLLSFSKWLSIYKNYYKFILPATTFPYFISVHNYWLISSYSQHDITDYL